MKYRLEIYGGINLFLQIFDTIEEANKVCKKFLEDSPEEVYIVKQIFYGEEVPGFRELVAPYNNLVRLYVLSNGSYIKIRKYDVAV